jgi:nucleoside recognition membrane protein YjiH
MVVATFTANIMTVNPMMTVFRPMAGNPDHLVVTFPVTRTMAVVWPVTEFNSKTLRLKSAPESEARNANRHEQ